ncbi:MAG TPA: translocation/assembly module TamB domain-containing protein [Burkholderiaceae bacterium]|nr:translocation/assembly module TamB domain-containing protein [Burkholderiaceae bacterium]
MVSDIARKPRSRLRAGLAVIAILIVLLSAPGYWLLGTENGMRAAFSALERLSAGAIQADGIHGYLADSVQVDRLSMNSANQQLTLTNMRLDWRPSALLQGRLHVRLLRIGHLAVTRKIRESPEPARLPDKIALPLKLQVDKVQIDGGQIDRGPVNIIRLGAFAFNIDFDGMRYRLGVDQLTVGSASETDSITGKFNGQATLSAIKPYALDARFSSSAEAIIGNRTAGGSGYIGARGSLADFATTFDLAINKAHAKGHVVLRPFSTQPLGNANVSVQALDLSSVDPKMPHTLLDLTLFAGEDGAGELTLINAAPGLYNETKMPISNLHIAFRQHAGQFSFDRVMAMLGSAKRPAGTVTGSGRYAGGALTLALRTSSLNLQRLDQRLRATQLTGTVDVRQAAGKQEFTIALMEPLKKNKLALSAHAVLADAGLAIDRAELRVGDGRVNASGHLNLSGRQDFSAQGLVSRFRLQDLGSFAQLPSLELNGNFSLRGTRALRLEADLAFQITESKFGGHPLQGDGQAQLRADSLIVPKLLLIAGANRLQMQGELSQRQSRLTFSLTAPNLEQLGPDFGGAIDANGSAHGSFDKPRVSIEWKAGNIRMPGKVQIGTMQGKADVDLDRNKPFFISTAAIDATASGLKTGERQLTSLSARLRFSPQPDAPLIVDLHGQGMSTGELRADSFNVKTDGTTAQHTLDALLVEPGQEWRLKASGGLRDLARSVQWQGSIERFDAAGRFVAHLTVPAALAVSQQRIQLDGFRLDANTAYVAIEQFVRDSRGMATHGRVERLQIAPLLKFAGPSPAAEADLQLDGEWNVKIADTLSGTVKFRRQRGDIVMRGSTPVALGLRILEASATASDGRIDLRLIAEGQQLGRIDVNADIGAAIRAGRFSIPPDALVSGSARIDIPTIGWAGPLLSPTLIAEGRMQSTISVSGTFAKPRFAGQIAGSGLRLFFTETGVDLRQGVLDGEFQDAELLVKALRFQNADGQLTISGPVNLASGTPSAQLSLIAQRFTLLNRSDRRLVISGESRIELAKGRVRIAGAFNVDSGFFDIGRKDAPRLSDDVVIVGRTEKSPNKIAAELDVSIALGDGVTVRGRGLNAVLAGQIRLLNAAGEPLQAQGSLRVAKGTYTAYGRELAIEQGMLRFTGPINNPALDILAMRRGQEVEAGVAVRGTVLAPRVTLVSEPSVPDAEKLSWLVLGHGLNTAGDTDMAALQTAAGVLLSESAATGVQSQIATAFGLDSVNLSTSQDNLRQRIVTVGKQISSRLRVSYQQGLETASSALLLHYTLSPRLTLEAEAGTRSALSLFYNIAFD